MKRFFALVLAAVLLSLYSAGVLAAELGRKVTTVEGGMSNVDFGDNYYGFCLDYHLGKATSGAQFTVKSTDENAKVNQKDAAGNIVKGTVGVANQLKLLFVENFEYFFTYSVGWWNYDESNNLIINSAKVGDLQNAIWKITNPDDFEMHIDESVLQMIENVRELDSQKYIPDHGYTKTYTNDRNQSIKVTFDFWSLSPEQKTINEDGSSKDMQSFFMYKVTTANSSATDSPLVTPSPKPEETESPKPEETETPKPENTPAPGDPGSGMNGGSADGLPKTGDDTKLALWLSLFAVTGVSLLVALRRRHMC